MRIIDNKKDYYDYLAGVYGIDDKVVYDRRGSVRLKDQPWFRCMPKLGVKAEPNMELPSKSDRSHRVYFDREWWRKDVIIRNRYCETYGQVVEFNLCIGFNKYTIITDRYVNADGTVGGGNWIRGCEKREKNLPVTCFEYEVDHWSRGNKIMAEIENSAYVRKDPKKKYQYWTACYIDNVIIEGTWLASMFIPEIVWDEIYEYVSAHNDKDFDDNRSDNEKILSNGFDTKTSFRNVK